MMVCTANSCDYSLDRSRQVTRFVENSVISEEAPTRVPLLQRLYPIFWIIYLKELPPGRRNRFTAENCTTWVVNSSQPQKISFPSSVTNFSHLLAISASFVGLTSLPLCIPLKWRSNRSSTRYVISPCRSDSSME